MPGSIRDSEFRRLTKQPNEKGRSRTQSTYIVAGHAGAYYARAKPEGAQIVMEIEDNDTGGRGYSCLDLDDHLWHFGSYDPWAG